MALRDCRRAARAHCGYGEPQEAARGSRYRVGRADGFRGAGEQLYDAADLARGRGRRRGGLRARGDELARGSVSAGPALAGAGAFHAGRAGRRRA